MVQDIERADTEIRELDQKLKQMQQSAAANRRGLELHEKRGQVQADLQRHRSKREEVDSEIPRLERDLQEKRREETNLTEIVQRAVKGENLATLASKYREAAGVIRTQAATDLRGGISEMVGDLWLDIAAQGREFAGIEFDSHWQCWLKKHDGSKISWDEANTSAGQRQVRMLAFYEALRQLARMVPPLVVDTPLARLDKQVRMSVLERLYLSGHQSVILTTDSEIDPDGSTLQDIESKLARVYTLSPQGDPNSRDYKVSVSANYFGRYI
jgi:DNA sulfur modification protein DndD